MSAASRLIGTTSVETFCNEVRDKKYARFASEGPPIYDMTRLDTLLTRSVVPTFQIDLIEEGWPRTLFEVQRSPNLEYQSTLAQRVSKGATLRIRDLQAFDETLDAFRRDLQREFLAECQINLYCTPPTFEGFDPHFDTHDVFIVQCSGAKRWRLYHRYTNELRLPLRDTRFDRGLYRPDGPFDEFVLLEGDVLYIPRGVMHAAGCLEQGSLHLTVSLAWPTPVEILQDVLARVAANSDAYRQSCLNADASPVGAIDSLKALLSALSNSDVIDRVVQERLQTLVAATVPRASELKQVIEPSSLPDQDVGSAEAQLTDKGVADPT